MKSTGKSSKSTTRSAAAPAKGRKATSPTSPSRTISRTSAQILSGRNGSNRAPAREAIAARAYELFLRSGRQHGRDLEHWLEAERELTRVK